MKVVGHDQVLSMGWCLQCHVEPESKLRPVDKVTDLSWQPSSDQAAREVGSAIKKDLAINPPMTCQGCHR
jgi:hypothetical protein